jgi:hypothetical protein
MFRVGTDHPMRRALLAAAVAVLAAVVGCGDQQPTEPSRPTIGPAFLGLPSPGATLLQCPTEDSQDASAKVEPLAETTLSLDGTSVLFPAGAVLEPVKVKLTIPESRYMEIRLRVKDAEHFDFLTPLTVTIDYSRCTGAEVLSKPLTVWYIDSQTKELLYPMGGVDNKLTRSVTFFTDHFSGYAIAF